MAVLSIGDQNIQVDDSFLKMSPDQQNATVDEIAKSIGVQSPLQQQGQPQADPNSQISADNLVRSAAQGVPIIGGLADKFAAGMDALTEPLLGRGSQADSIGQRYSENIANEQAHTNAFNQAHPYASAAAGLAGGLGALGAAAKTTAGAKLLGLTGQTLPQQIAQGMASGAGINAADAVTRGNDPLEAAETGALFGGAAPVAGRAVGEITSGAGSTLAKIAEPFTQAGREARANRIISEFAQSAPVQTNTAPLAGSSPTAAQATANPGLAALERQLRNMPGEPNAAFTARDAANTEARNAAFGGLSGDQVTLDMLRNQRSADAEQNLQTAFGSSPQVNPQGIVRVIDNILASKSGQRQAVQSALNAIRDQIVLPNPLEDRISQASDIIRAGLSGASQANIPQFKAAAKLLRQANNGDIEEGDLISGLSKLAKGQKIVGPIDNALSIIKQGPSKLQTDAEQLYGIRQNAGDKMKFSGSAEKLASSELINVQNAIDRAIQKQASAYSTYLKTYASQSKPIDVQQLLQSANVTDSKGNITLGKLDSFIKNIERGQKQSGAMPAKSVMPGQLNQLRAIRDDLRMSQNSSLGKAIGSNTVQNLMSNGHIESFLRNQAAAPVIGGLLGSAYDMSKGETPGEGAVGGALMGGLLGGRFAKSDADVIDRLVRKMLNPGEAAKAISGTAANKLSQETQKSLAKINAARRAAILSHAASSVPQSRNQ